MSGITADELRWDRTKRISRKVVRLSAAGQEEAKINGALKRSGALKMFLRDFRERNGLCIHIVAAAAGISVEMLTKIEEGMVQPSEAAVRRIIEAIKACSRR